LGKVYRGRSAKALRYIKDIDLRLGEAKKKFRFNVIEELRITQSNSGIIEHAERFAFWRRMQAEMTMHRRQTEQELEEMRANLSLQFREQLKDEGKSTTEATISAMLRSDPGVYAVQTKLNRALYDEDICKMMVESFDHRRTVIMKLTKSE